jgi:TatD DNase family protein
VKLFDAHNHLQDARFAGRQDRLIEAAVAAGVAGMVVNGACEEDWADVLALGRRHRLVVPSLGYHPWYIHQRTSGWLERLAALVDSNRCVIGEIGIDRWIGEQPPEVRARYVPELGLRALASIEEQSEVFVQQLELSTDRNLPASVHCIQAWGLLDQLLRQHRRPPRGLLLHSYGGSAEMIPVFAELGAYFSFPGYYLHDRKVRQREVFRAMPIDRLLVETDAPDQGPPEKYIRFPLTDPVSGKAINHPANLGAIYTGLAEIRGIEVEALAERVAENFARLFGFGEPQRHGEEMK